MFEPSKELLVKYADLLVNFALGSGEGIKKGEVVQIFADDVAKPFLIALRNEVLKAGGHPIVKMIPTLASKEFYELASEEQLKFFPEKYFKERVDLVDHTISVISDVDPKELAEVDPKKIFMARDARKKIREWCNEKEHRGEFTWTLALYGTEAMAKEADMDLEEFWNVIIDACYLHEPDPKVEWRRILNEQERIKKALDDLEIEWVNVKGENIDLNVQIGKDRSWLGGSGRNVPSYEIFTSPNWRGTNGYIYFNQPLYRYGNLIKDIRLEFEDGIVTKATASEGENLLLEMLKSENADKAGEFSLTDKRFSRIEKFTANTLFDENIGGEFGNTHVAIGMAYKDAYKGDPSKPTKEEWEEKGYNDSPEHTDIISTEDRVVTATLQDGSKKVIYENGEFVV